MTDAPLPELPKRPAKYDDLPPSPYAPLFIEKLLLAIIARHDVPAETFGVKSEGQLSAIRLQRAMQALFGIPIGPVAEYDLPALVAAAKDHLWLDSCREFEKRVLGWKLGRAEVPFSKAVGLEGQTQTDSPERNRYVRLERKYRQRPYAEYLYWLVNVREHEEEEAMEADLKTVAEILARWMIPTDIDPEKLGMLSRTHS